MTKAADQAAWMEPPTKKRAVRKKPYEEDEKAVRNEVATCNVDSAKRAFRRPNRSDNKPDKELKMTTLGQCVLIIKRTCLLISPF